MRGIAATLVVLLHASISKGFAGHPPLGGLASFGYSGVDIFFVLSGFIISYVHHRDLGHPRLIGPYLYKRVARVYPFYWIVLAATFLERGVTPGSIPPADLFRSITLVHGPGLFVGIAWTLQYEVLFYALFALAVLHRNLGRSVLLAWFGISAVLLATNGHENSAFGGVFGRFNLEFFFGVVAAQSLLRWRIGRPRLLFLVGVALFASLAAADVLHVLPTSARETYRLGYGLAALLVVLGLSAWELKAGIRVPRALLLAGNASYAIYLTHVKTISLIGRAAPWVTQLRPSVAFAVLSAAGVGAGIGVHLLVEAPLQRWLRRRGPVRTAPAT